MNDVAALATVLSAVLGIFGVFQWRLSRGQLKLDVMSRVHERYIVLYDAISDLPDVVSKYEHLSSKSQAAISAYINLCAEQFHWRESERIIDDSVWRVWKIAIAQKLQHPAIRCAWNEYHRYDVYYEGFCDFIDNQYKANPKFHGWR